MLFRSASLPTGVTFDAATGVLSGTPAAGTANTYPITFTATNGVGSPATQSFTLTVNPATSTSASVSLALSHSSVPYGKEGSETFTVQVTGVSGGATPTGTVTIQSGSTPLCTITLSAGSGSSATSGGVASGHCSLTPTQLAGGSYQVTAAYSGDSNYSGSSSGAQTLAISAATTTTSLAPSQIITFYGWTETFKVKVTGANGGAAPTGTVTVRSGQKTLCTISLAAVTGGSATGQCSVPSSELPFGFDLVTATYAPGSNPDYQASTSDPIILLVL